MQESDKAVDSGSRVIPHELQVRLKHCRDFPSPPAIAERVLAIAKDPEAEIAQLADVVSKDPALAAKVLRIANSSLYSRRRKSQNVRQALSLLGMNAGISLALSFSLGRLVQSRSEDGLDISHFWKRSLLAAICARQLGEFLGRADEEELFLAGLLHCMGMMALDRLDPEIYASQPQAQYRARESVEVERRAAGADHSQVGAWLLRSWGLPDGMCRAAGLRFALESDPSVAREDPFAACVAIAAQLAEWWLSGTRSSDGVASITEAFREQLGLDATQFEQVLSRVRDRIPETESVFETSLVEAGQADMLLEDARELLLVRTLHSSAENVELRGTAEVLESRTRELEESGRYDDLTGVYNRGRLDSLLDSEFETSSERGWPLTVLFVDLDKFKRINDTHGHPFGDRVLRTAAQLLEKSTRDRDIVGRYGGEEFLILLPGHNARAGEIVSQRVLESFRQHRLVPDEGEAFNVTVSIGIAEQIPGQGYPDVRSLVAAADRALYEAKRLGRDRFRVARRPAGV